MSPSRLQLLWVSRLCVNMSNTRVDPSGLDWSSDYMVHYNHQSKRAIFYARLLINWWNIILLPVLEFTLFWVCLAWPYFCKLGLIILGPLWIKSIFSRKYNFARHVQVFSRFFHWSIWVEAFAHVAFRPHFITRLWSFSYFVFFF